MAWDKVVFLIRHQGPVVIAGIQGVQSTHTQSCPDSVGLQCGIALEADVQRLLLSEPLFARLTGQIGDFLGRGFALSLRLSNFAANGAGKQFEQLGAGLSAALDAPGPHMANLEINLPAGSAPPDTAWQVCSERLGVGRLTIICDDAGNVDEGLWLRLWRLRHESRVSIALWPVLRGPSRLLPSELARNVEPCMGLQVPTESAWLAASISLPMFIDSNSRLDASRMQAVLADLISSLDAAHDSARWPTPGMQQDAWLNRRLAVQIDGVGDAVAMLGLDPRDESTQRRLRHILRQVRGGLTAATRRMARHGHVLPAIDAGNPVRGIASGPVRDRWEQRWQKAVERGGVRHRNLLTLSPWALFPGKRAERRYFALLALLAEADSCVFGGRPSLASWNSNDFKHFYQSLWAVRRRVEAKTLVAERL